MGKHDDFNDYGSYYKDEDGLVWRENPENPCVEQELLDLVSPESPLGTAIKFNKAVSLPSDEPIRCDTKYERAIQDGINEFADEIERQYEGKTAFQIIRW